MISLVQRLLTWLGLWRGPFPPGAPGDPYAWKPAPVRPRPKGRTSVALAEPDDD